MRYRLKRALCNLLGCICADSFPGCHRCEAGIYDADFVQIGWLDPVFRAYLKVRRFVQKLTGKHCQVCHRRYWGGDDWTCSNKCFNEWLPF